MAILSSASQRMPPPVFETRPSSHALEKRPEPTHWPHHLLNRSNKPSKLANPTRQQSTNAIYPSNPKSNSINCRKNPCEVSTGTTQSKQRTPNRSHQPQERRMQNPNEDHTPCTCAQTRRNDSLQPTTPPS